MKKVKYGELYTIDEFCELLDKRIIIPYYDGCGYYAVGEIETEEHISSSSSFVRRTASKKGYTGVIWHNK